MYQSLSSQVAVTAFDVFVLVSEMFYAMYWRSTDEARRARQMQLTLAKSAANKVMWLIEMNRRLPTKGIRLASYSTYSVSSLYETTDFYVSACRLLCRVCMYFCQVCVCTRGVCTCKYMTTCICCFNACTYVVTLFSLHPNSVKTQVCLSLESSFT